MGISEEEEIRTRKMLAELTIFKSCKDCIFSWNKEDIALGLNKIAGHRKCRKNHGSITADECPDYKERKIKQKE